MPLRAPIFDVGEPPRHVHFITSGMASTVTTLRGGDAVEVAISGREGFPEALHVLGPQTGEIRSFMQVEGTALRMDFKRFVDEFHRNEVLRNLVLRYVQSESLVMAQLSACNRLHEVEERLARWLLMVSDRIESTRMQLTQEFLAEMIGARRSTVTIAAGTLQRSGIIEYSRGKIAILDRTSLTDAACECYPVADRLFTTLYL
ncbi:MAG TPA: Crp/Fnr family transcriptional regulator [Acidobacteriaceae bacterium]|jgi:CRP-like cAMP-binding protein|nr:Crp/Fnr family transcriptional regulator [Acidobacteriaceae bacterium]